MSPAQIQVGESVPAGLTAKFGGPMTVFDVTAAVASGRHVIVTVPGAATPTCSSQIPAYMTSADKFKAKGVDTIFVVAVNDSFVVGAWSSRLSEQNPAPEAGTEIKFLADDTGALSAALGISFDATPVLGGHRAKRAAIVIQDGKVVAVEVEANPSEITVSASEAVLAKL